MDNEIKSSMNRYGWAGYGQNGDRSKRRQTKTAAGQK